MFDGEPGDQVVCGEICCGECQRNRGSTYLTARSDSQVLCWFEVGDEVSAAAAGICHRGRAVGGPWDTAVDQRLRRFESRAAPKANTIFRVADRVLLMSSASVGRGALVRTLHKNRIFLRVDAVEV